MDTTWRNTTVKSRVTLGRASLLLVGIGLQSAIVAVPGIAQVTMGSSGQSQSAPTTLQGAGAGLAASIGKSATAGQNQGPVVLPKDFSQLRVEPGDLLSISVYD